MSKEINFVFEKDPDYRIVPANGAWGGVTSRGDINFDLFFEHIDTPEDVAYMATPDGLGPEVKRTPEQTPIKREIFFGVVMNVDSAENFGKWLLEKVKLVRQRGGGQNFNKPE